MSDADDAYKEVKRLIAKAIAANDPVLSLNTPKTRALTNLPPTASELTHLKWLSLDNTHINDASLEQITSMQVLQTLNLDNTPITSDGLSYLADSHTLQILTLNYSQVEDLRPLLKITSVGYGESYGENYGGGRKLQSLSFIGIPALDLDPKLAELSKIKDDKERTTKTFAYLREVGDDWPPGSSGKPSIPKQIPAPIQAEFSDDILTERQQPSDLPADTEKRAQQGWEALSEFHSDVQETLMKGNLPNLERAILAFGRALGNDFTDVRQIALGTHGQRIIEISKTAGDTLMDDAAGDLLAFAAAIDLHLQRFPEWVAYLQDDPVTAAPTPPISSVTDDLRSLSAAFGNANFIAEGLLRKFDDLVAAVEDKDLPDELIKKGVLGSLSNILSPIFERVISAGKKLGGDLGKEVYKKSIQATATAIVGAPIDLIVNDGNILLSLAQKFPNKLGWIETVLRFLGYTPSP